MQGIHSYLPRYCCYHHWYYLLIILSQSRESNFYVILKHTYKRCFYNCFHRFRVWTWDQVKSYFQGGYLWLFKMMIENWCVLGLRLHSLLLILLVPAYFVVVCAPYTMGFFKGFTLGIISVSLLLFSRGFLYSCFFNY